MAEFNSIKVKQLDSSVWQYVTGIITGSFSTVIAQFLTNGGGLGSSVVYAANFDQNISGKKTFVQSPSLPYTGASGDATSRRYIDDQIGVLSAIVNPLAGASFLYATGNNLISGDNYFLGNLYTDLIQNTGNDISINLSEGSLQNSATEITLDWEGRELLGDWTVGGHSLMFLDANQTVQGIKTFTTQVNVPFASSTGSAVPYSQFQQELSDSGQYFDSLFNVLSNSTASGFGGILSLNGQSGNIFTQGRGSVTVYQRGNILNISGAEIIRESGDSLFRTNTVDITSGVSVQRINFSLAYDNQPIVISQLVNSSSDPMLASLVSGVDTSGFSIILSDTADSNDYKLSYVAFDATGVINLLRGEQGLMGPYLKGQGVWETGKTYGYLDFVRGSNGVAWYSKTGHLSASSNGPETTGGAAYWDILSSGAGPRGDNAVPFIFVGTWDDSTPYSSGEAVLFMGSSYATLYDTNAGDSPTGSPWFVVAAGGETGIGFYFEGDWDSDTSYNQGDVVRFNGGVYTQQNETSVLGANHGPISLNTRFDVLTPKSLSYRGEYSAVEAYYPYDIASTSTGFNVGESAQFINSLEVPLYGIHPYGYGNMFTDCDGFTGYNLIQLTTGLKDLYHPYYGSGNDQGFKVNNLSINALGSGLGTLVLIRGQKYYFDSELRNCPFIFTTSPSGGSYDGQIVEDIVTGSILSVNSGSYESAAYDEHVASGSLIFTPSNSTPDVVYYQSPVNTFMGWKILVVDSNPWKVFSSGQRGDDGDTGPSGARGYPGLAFAWRGDWSSIIGYNSGDAVYYEGSSYATESSIMTTQPTEAPWFLIAQKGASGEDARGLAFVWRGTWSSGYGYEPNDSVYYQGTSYATTGSPSGNFPPSLFGSDWFPIARQGSSGASGLVGSPGLAFNWQGNYNNATNYNSGDAVFFQGSSYGTRSGIVGVDPVYTGVNPWELIAQKGGTIFSWRGTWSPYTAYYSGDSVYHSGSSYATLTYTENHDPLDMSSNPWFVVAQGSSGARGSQGIQGAPGSGGVAFAWRGAWSAMGVYSPKDAVSWGGSSYGTLELISGSSTTPNLSSKWFTIAEKGAAGLAFDWEGDWSAATLYKPNQAVYYNGRSYATTDYITTGVVPNPTSGPWFVIADKGGVDYMGSFYERGNVNSILGFNVFEQIVCKDLTFTGYSLGLANHGGGGSSISGCIYRKNVTNSKFIIANFTLGSAEVFMSSGEFNYSIFNMDRIGIDISGGDIIEATGFSIGVFGWSESN